MTTTVSAQRLRAALQRAQDVGRIEEEVTIASCPIVLRSLPPEDYPAIVQELEDTPEEEYIFAFQLENISRALVEIDGQDLRGIDYIEDEVPAGSHLIVLQLPSETAAKNVAKRITAELKLKPTLVPPDTDGEVRTIKVTRHEWVRKNVLASWGYEAISVAWRKFHELRVKAEEKAKEGVQFHIAEETAEEKARRLLTDLVEAGEDLPSEILDRVYAEYGLLRKARQEELEAVNQRLTKLAQTEQAAPQPDAEPVDDATPPPPPPPRRRSIADIAAQHQAVQDEPDAPPAAPVRQDPQALMRGRQPLNQQYTDAPAPPASAQPVPAQMRSKVPEQVRAEARQNMAGLNPTIAVPDLPAGAPARAREIAALEAMGLDDGGIDGGTILPTQPVNPPARLRQNDGRPVEATKQEKVDPKSLRGIIDTPPAAGLNPRFKPRT